MQSFCSRALCATLLVPAALFAQDVTSQGVIAVGGGGALLDGDRPAFQRIFQHKKDGFGGIEEFRIGRETKESLFTFNARILPGDGTYRLVGRYEKPDRVYLEAGFSEFRVWYDGSGGYFQPTGTGFTMFNEDLSLKRGKIWAEAGLFTPNKTLFKFRYERSSRNGTKDSTHWGDTNLVGTFGTRNIVPQYYDLDETTDAFIFEVGNETQENVKWKVGARYAETKLNNTRWVRRRPFEAADRQITTKDQTKTDIFSANGYYSRQVNEQLTVSAGALRTNLDSKISGSRIYGQSYDPVFDPAYIRRQQRDEGFYGLHGDAQIKQTVLNLNAVYVPKKNWSVRPSLRFENQHKETIAEFMETNIGASPSFAAILEEGEGDQKQKWNELTESVEVRYTGVPNWTFNGKGEWMQGEGDHQESRILHHTIVSIDRDMELTRKSQKYSFTANWYARPGLSFAAQYYFKNNVNDYDARRKDKLPTGGDRYPGYITDQDFETNDVNFRVSWRPVSMLNLVTRYDNQQSKILTGADGLAMVRSSTIKSHILSQNATWSPTSRLYLNGNVNLTYDQMNTPAIALVDHSDNNYVNGSLGAGYALAKLDDIYVDYSWFRARNGVARSAVLLPYNLSQKTQAGYVTWVRRQTDHLVYTLKYGYITNRDMTWSGLNNFNAHVFYGKVQYSF